MNSIFICPVCGEALLKSEKSYFCRNRHSFDIAKQGYVNLLQSQQTSLKHHGDDRLMVRSRREFLDKGYYSVLREKLCDTVSRYSGDETVYLDSGCGEGYYTEAVVNRLADEGKLLLSGGIDISKTAAAYAAKRCQQTEFCAASAFSMPVADESVNIVTNVFAPDAYGEFSRILKSGGILIKVYPLENHLIELKKIVYDNAYVNDPVEADAEGFENIENISVTDTVKITGNDDVLNLFRMTPYYYKTGAEDQKKLSAVDALNVTLEFGISVYRKKLKI